MSLINVALRGREFNLRHFPSEDLEVGHKGILMPLPKDNNEIEIVKEWESKGHKTFSATEPQEISSEMLTTQLATNVGIRSQLKSISEDSKEKLSLRN